MTKFAIIEGNRVVNIVISEQALAPNWVPLAASEVSVNDHYQGGEFIPSITPDVPIPPERPLEPIVVQSVLGALKHDSGFTHITCYELTSLTVSGHLAIPDRIFAMPLRRDDGRLFLFPVEVKNGKFEVMLNFPTTGQFTYTDEEANHDLPEPMFSVEPIKIDVLRNITM